MNLPKSIRVGYIDYAVVELPPREAEACSLFGDHSKIMQQIRVRMDVATSEQANTLLHEVMHAAYQMGCLSDSADQEKVVSVFANQLTQVWRDNPEFVAFMSEALTPASA